MEYLYYAVAAVALYFLSDWVLVRIEQARGKQFAEQRSLVFLLIIMTLAVSSFKLIELMVKD